MMKHFVSLMGVLLLISFVSSNSYSETEVDWWKAAREFQAEDPKGYEKARKMNNTRPICFVENMGQFTDMSIRFVMSSSLNSIVIRNDGIQINRFVQSPQLNKYSAQSLEFNFVGANPVLADGNDLADGRFGFISGPEDRWIEDAKGFNQIIYNNIYAGVDAVLSGQEGNLKLDFYVAPQSDYKSIKVGLNGHNGISLTSNGALAIETSFGTIYDTAPYVYQIIDGAKKQIATNYRIIDQNTYGFEITGDYDPAVGIVIDPEIRWATYHGGLSEDVLCTVDTDADGSMFIGGASNSFEVNSVNGEDIPFTEGPRFDAPLNPLGDDDGIIFFKNGNGKKGDNTVGANTAPQFQNISNGLGAATFSKYSRDGEHLFTYFISGTYSEIVNTIHVSGVNKDLNVYIGGTTTSSIPPGGPCNGGGPNDLGFPTSIGAYKGAMCRQSVPDGFIMVIGRDGVVYHSTLHGPRGVANTGADYVFDIDSLDFQNEGNSFAYAVGATNSNGFETPGGKFQSFGGGAIRWICHKIYRNFRKRYYWNNRTIGYFNCLGIIFRWFRA